MNTLKGPKFFDGYKLNVNDLVFEFLKPKLKYICGKIQYSLDSGNHNFP